MPKTIAGVSIYLFAIFIMVTIMFADNYKWFNFSNMLTPKSKRA